MSANSSGPRMDRIGCLLDVLTEEQRDHKVKKVRGGIRRGGMSGGRMAGRRM
jgi:hypothetical protein